MIRVEANASAVGITAWHVDVDAVHVEVTEGLGGSNEWYVKAAPTNVDADTASVDLKMAGCSATLSHRSPNGASVNANIRKVESNIPFVEASLTDNAMLREDVSSKENRSAFIKSISIIGGQESARAVFGTKPVHGRVAV